VAASMAAPPSGRGRIFGTIGFVAAFAVPAAVAWAVVSVILHVVPTWLLLPLAIVYATLFGITESLGLTPRAPSSSWQVPSGWVAGRSGTAQSIIWGSFLGPGLLTRNPLGGIWLVLVMLGLLPDLRISVVVAIVAGALHGGSRAVGALVNMRKPEADGQILLRIRSRVRWVWADGLGLLIASGSLLGYVFR
jgi:hypothetical protein